MFFQILFLLFLFSTCESSSDLTSNLHKNEMTKNEEFLQNKITNLENEIVFLRNCVSKIEENDLESNITEIMRILEAHGLVSILQTFIVMHTVSKKQYLFIKIFFIDVLVFGSQGVAKLFLGYY